MDYRLLLLVHILAGMAWVGGGIVMAGTLFAARHSEPPDVVDRVMRSLAWADTWLALGAPLVVVITGVAMVLISGASSFEQAWILGSIGLVVAYEAIAMTVGARLYRRVEDARAQGHLETVGHARTMQAWGRSRGGPARHARGCGGPDGPQARDLSDRARRMRVEQGHTGIGLPYLRFGSGPRRVVGIAPLTPANTPTGGLGVAAMIDRFRFLDHDYTVDVVNRRAGLQAGVTIADMAADYAAMIETEFVPPVDVVGVSTGGTRALQLAADRRDLLRRLVIYSRAHRLGDPAKPVMLHEVRASPVWTHT